MSENIISPKAAFVAMFDFLGFKNMRESRGTNGLYKLYSNGLLPLIQHSAALKSKTENRDGNSVSVADFGEHSVQYRVISDSIFLFTKGNSLVDFIQIISASHQLLCGSFVGHGMPLRGAVGYGDLIFDAESIWIGSAIEDAYIGESIQAWAGCILTKNCEDFVHQNNYIDQHKVLLAQMHQKSNNGDEKNNITKTSFRLVKYPIPIQFNPKDGPVNYEQRDGIALNWTVNVYRNASTKAFAKTSNVHANIIQQNTIDFEEWARGLTKTSPEILMAF